MRTLIIHIETIGESWDSFGEEIQTALTAWIPRTGKSTSEQDALVASVKQRLGLSPYTGRIIAIGLYDVELKRGVVYYENTETVEDFKEGEFVYKVRTEYEMLEDFWSGAKSYDTFVTYNGREFDISFLTLRSAIKRIRPSMDLMPNRYTNHQSGIQVIDLLDKLTWYGSVRKRPSLPVVCNAFGVNLHDEIFLASDLGTAHADKKYRRSARLTALYTQKLLSLYILWQQYLNPVLLQEEDGV